jgi:menaquinol-cytochrome c reductase iron-sulfur subunit
MAPICTHLDCTVPHASEKDKKENKELAFKCPCHMGLYNEQGINIGDPPPRQLDIFEPFI